MDKRPSNKPPAPQPTDTTAVDSVFEDIKKRSDEKDEQLTKVLVAITAIPSLRADLAAYVDMVNGPETWLSEFMDNVLAYIRYHGPIGAACKPEYVLSLLGDELLNFSESLKKARTMNQLFADRMATEGDAKNA
jgi:hypothetical protein